MARIAVSEGQGRTYSGTATPGYVRLFLSKTFTNSEGVRVHGSSLVTGKKFYQQIPVAFLDGVYTIQAISDDDRIDSTTDGRTSQNAYYTVVLYSTTGKKLDVVYSKLRVPPTPTTTSWDALELYTTSANPPVTSDLWTLIQSFFSNLSIAGIANTLTLGKLRISFAADDLSNPTAVSISDPVYKTILQRRALREWASLSAALTALGSVTPVELIVSDLTNVTANITKPANVRFVLEGSGGFNISTGVTLTIAGGAGFEAPPDKQVFSGSGNVLFSNTLPSIMYPEWWGAGTTGDDLGAFDKMLLSYAATKTARIRLADGKVYTLSDTWEIDKPVDIFGAGNYYSPELLFPVNTSGIIFHSNGTKTGIADGKTSNYSAMTGVKLIGNNRASITSAPTYTHTVNVNGTTVTRTSGDSFADTPAFGEGITITIHGYTYIIASRTNANVLELLPTPLRVTATNGSAVLNAGDYYTLVAGDWDGQDIEIDGVTYEIALSTAGDGSQPASGTITLTSPYLGTTGNYDAFLQGLATASGLSARVNNFHGIDVRSVVTIEDCAVEGFSGNGISCGGSDDQGITGSTPNSNTSSLVDNDIFHNAGHGIFTEGINANQIAIEEHDCTDNRGCGVWEYSGLGNQYKTNHYSFNRSGAVRCVRNSVNFSTFAFEYSEGGQPAEIYGQNMLKLGGTCGAGINTILNQGGWIRQESSAAVANSLSVRKLIGLSNPKAVGFHAGINTNVDNFIYGFGAGEEAANLYGAIPATDARYPALQMIYEALQKGWYSEHFKNTSLSTVGDPIYAVSGSEAGEGGGHFWLPDGFFAGLVGSTRRRWKYVSSIPTSGDTNLFDIFWNLGADAAAPIGWVTTVAGRIGASPAAGTFTAATTDIITDVSHGFSTGTLGQCTTTTTLPAGLSLATNYWVIRIDDDHYYLATSYANSLAGTQVNITDTGTGTHTFTPTTATIKPFGATGLSAAITATATLDFGSIAAQTGLELTVAVTGAAVGDVAYASPNTSVESGLVWSAYVSSANTVTIRLANVTVASIDPASKSWKVWVNK